MQRAEFDPVADDYGELHRRNIRASGETPEFFSRYKVVDVLAEVSRAGLEVSDILDFGSGIGNSLPHFLELFPKASVTCADVSVRSLDVCRARFGTARSKYTEIDGPLLPFASESFDLVFSSCVFHHIAPVEHGAWLEELRRVVRPGGMLIIFEHNPRNPLTVAAVNSCPFDENAILIDARVFANRVEGAGWQSPKVVFRVFFPKLLSFARPAERWMKRLPFGAQYFVLARRMI